MASHSQKIKKYQTRQEIDLVINNKMFPDSQVAKSGRSNRHNINSVLVSYAATLQKEATSTTIQFHNSPQHTVKRHIIACYDDDNITAFPVIGNKKGNTSKNLATFTRPSLTLPLLSQKKNLPLFQIYPTTTFLKFPKLTILLSKKNRIHLQE